MGGARSLEVGQTTTSKTGHDTITTNLSSGDHQQHSDLEKDHVASPGEVFQETSEGVNFRTVSWQRATVLFLKIQFAMSILAVPSSLGTLGAVGGALSIVGWQSLNTCAYYCIILYNALKKKQSIYKTKKRATLFLTMHNKQTPRLFWVTFGTDTPSATVSQLYNVRAVIVMTYTTNLGSLEKINH